ncbi:iap-like protein [Heliothis virescens ascovirus 3e]|uniref:Iap-like protein n=1 Tax=Heliothis virescens ascovirus 3e TaxID=260797 RepID=A4KXA6_HVAVE|nr:iap-like protein [Heliothis virescens ascovirus 3e]ABO37237.1 iap-like protein [Heliothis virescens ascovirus 3e]
MSGNSTTSSVAGVASQMISSFMNLIADSSLSETPNTSTVASTSVQHLTRVDLEHLKSVLVNSISVIDQLLTRQAEGQARTQSPPTPPPVITVPNDEEDGDHNSQSILTNSFITDFMQQRNAAQTSRINWLGVQSEDYDSDDSFEASRSLTRRLPQAPLRNRRLQPYTVLVRRRRETRSPEPSGIAKRTVTHQVRRAALRHADRSTGEIATCLRQFRTEFYSNKLCCVCYTAEASCTILPCTHRNMCKRCLGRLNECPTCRSNIIVTVNRCQ